MWRDRVWPFLGDGVAGDVGSISMALPLPPEFGGMGFGLLSLRGWAWLSSMAELERGGSDARAGWWCP